MSKSADAKPNRSRVFPIAYWTATVLVALNFAVGGITCLLGMQASTEVFTRLGYPAYFGNYLSTWQLLAAIAILIPKEPRLIREWAYAGLVFDIISALYSLAAIRSPLAHFFPAVVILVLVLISYGGWRKRQPATQV